MTTPNVVVIVADDLGFSDPGCYGGELRTSTLDRLAAEGVRLSQFYSGARCSPSRASLLTGLHPQQVGLGILTNDDRPRDYPGTLVEDCVTMAEILAGAGYATGMAGKWHLAAEVRRANGAWPLRRGFGQFFGTLSGCGSYYDPPTLTRGESNAESEARDPTFFYTDAISDEAIEFVASRSGSHPRRPFFLTGEDGFTATASVHTFAPNGYGLFNMVGNVWEWCSDWFSTYSQARAARDPAGPGAGTTRVIRGGSYLCHESYCFRYRVAARSSNTPDSSTAHAGFRVVRSRPG